MFNYTHIPVSCLVVLVAFYMGLDAWFVWSGVSMMWVGREVSQAEYRYMNKRKINRSQMPWWKGYDLRHWSFKSSMMDMILPALLSGGLLTLLTYFW